MIIRYHNGGVRGFGKRQGLLTSGLLSKLKELVKGSLISIEEGVFLPLISGMEQRGQIFDHVIRVDQGDGIVSAAGDGGRLVLNIDGEIGKRGELGLETARDAPKVQEVAVGHPCPLQ